MYTPFNLITRLKIIKDALKIKIEKAITNILHVRKVIVYVSSLFED